MNTPAAAFVRPLGWILGIALVLGTVLLVALNLNLVAKPPEFPDSATLVDRLLGSQDFRHTIWPFDLAANLLLCVGLIAAVPFVWLTSAGIDPGDPRRRFLVAMTVTGAFVGIVATLAYVGAVKVTIDTAYCDCGFKEQESISQFWALSLVSGSRDWLLDGTATLIAVGVAVAGRAFSQAMGRGPAAVMPVSWTLLSYLAAATLALGAVLQITGIGDPAGSLISAVATGVLLPIWSIWLARRFSTAETHA